MHSAKFKLLSEKLNNLACKECTRGWLRDYESNLDPFKDIQQCFERNLINAKLYERLIKEVREIKMEK